MPSESPHFPLLFRDSTFYPLRRPLGRLFKFVLQKSKILRKIQIRFCMKIQFQKYANVLLVFCSQNGLEVKMTVCFFGVNRFVTGTGMKERRFGLRFPGWKKIFLLHKIQIVFGIHSVFIPTSAWAFPQLLKWPEREVDHKSQANFETTNEWSHISSPK